MTGLRKQIGIFIGLVLAQATWAAGKDEKSCQERMERAKKNLDAWYNGNFGYIQELRFNYPDIEFAVHHDGSMATGATLFYFPHGASMVVDERGGSTATVETSLLAPGSYSNVVDALVFAGGSSMGLAAADGVRAALFATRKGAQAFDRIPSVPAAVVYDYDARILKINKPLVYPNHKMGEALFKKRQSGLFVIGKAGAGTSSSVNKIDQARWGGQGAAFMELPGGIKIFVAVVLNSLGDIYARDGKSLTAEYPPLVDKPPQAPQPRRNTTLSLVATNAPLDRDQLKRIAAMVHTSMAARIRPFHSPWDGDALFAASTANKDAPLALPALPQGELEFTIGQYASELMSQAIEGAVRQSNLHRLGSK